MNPLYYRQGHIQERLPVSLFLEFLNALTQADGPESTLDTSLALLVAEPFQQVSAESSVRSFPMEEGRTGFLLPRDTGLTLTTLEGNTLYCYHDPLQQRVITSDFMIVRPKIGADAVDQWLANGQTGSSSLTLCKHLFDREEVIETSAESHPHDPSDLLRCRWFLDMTQSHEYLAGMKRVSPEWATLVDHWEELCSLMDSETAWSQGDLSGTASQTYDRMQALLSAARAPQRSSARSL